MQICVGSSFGLFSGAKLAGASCVVGSSLGVFCVGNLAGANLCRVFVWGVFCGVAAKLCRVLVWEFTGRGIIFDPGLLCKKN